MFTKLNFLLWFKLKYLCICKLETVLLEFLYRKCILTLYLLRLNKNNFNTFLILTDEFIFSVLRTVKHWKRFLRKIMQSLFLQISLKNSFICTMMNLTLLSHYRCAVIYKISGSIPSYYCKNTTTIKPIITYFHTDMNKSTQYTLRSKSPWRKQQTGILSILSFST